MKRLKIALMAMLALGFSLSPALAQTFQERVDQAVASCSSALASNPGACDNIVAELGYTSASEDYAQVVASVAEALIEAANASSDPAVKQAIGATLDKLSDAVGGAGDTGLADALAGVADVLSSGGTVDLGGSDFQTVQDSVSPN